MKVKDLEVGMLVQPAGDNEGFLKVDYNTISRKGFPYVTVRVSSTHVNVRKTPRTAMYLGTRKDVTVSKSEMSWSNRFVMLGNEVVAVDPSSWARMKPVFE